MIIGAERFIGAHMKMFQRGLFKKMQAHDGNHEKTHKTK